MSNNKIMDWYKIKIKNGLHFYFTDYAKYCKKIQY